jgi:hypothetical protein
MNALRAVRGLAGIALLFVMWAASRRRRRRAPDFEDVEPEPSEPDPSEPEPSEPESSEAGAEPRPIPSEVGLIDDEHLTELAGLVVDGVVLARDTVRVDGDGTLRPANLRAPTHVAIRFRIDARLKDRNAPRVVAGRAGDLRWRVDLGGGAPTEIVVLEEIGASHAAGLDGGPPPGAKSSYVRYRLWLAPSRPPAPDRYLLMRARVLSEPGSPA